MINCAAFLRSLANIVLVLVLQKLTLRHVNTDQCLGKPALHDKETPSLGQYCGNSFNVGWGFLHSIYPTLLDSSRHRVKSMFLRNTALDHNGSLTY